MDGEINVEPFVMTWSPQVFLSVLIVTYSTKYFEMIERYRLSLVGFRKLYLACDSPFFVIFFAYLRYF